MNRCPVVPIALTLAVLAAPAVNAAVFTPTKTADTFDGACNRDCSLREAIGAANANPGADVILLPAGTYLLSLTGAQEDDGETGDLDLHGELTVVGAGAASTILDGALADRVLQVFEAAERVELRDLTIRNGRSTTSGGGILNSAQLTLSRVAVLGNGTTSFGGGISSDEVLVVNDSTIAGNEAVRAGGGVIAGGSLTLTNTTVSGNRSTSDFGGGIYLFGGTGATINNATITANTAASRGGGTFVESSAFIGQEPPRFSNTILAGNTAASDPDCSGAAISGGHNLLGNGAGCLDFRPAVSDAEGTGAALLDPRLGPLGGNGGPTPTHALLTGSPARDAGAAASCESDDQRGLARPGSGSGQAVCDIGAFEVSSACIDGGASLCLNNGRFRVSATWRTPQGQMGDAQAVRLTGDSGYLWFFDPSNIEITIKVLDACALNQRYWVFASGLTNVRVDLRVEDTVTGAVKTYTNPQGTSYVPQLDTSAFATCP
jgi:CSLREA domain-containing protein